MQYLVLAILFVVSCVYYLTEKTHILPPQLAFLPEGLSALVVLYVIVAGAAKRFHNVRAQYWIVFGLIAVIIVCGIVSNQVAPGPVFAGLRYYARAIPLFFLPAVYAFTEENIRKQMRLLLLVCLVQFPLAVRERLVVMHSGRWSGDSVVGSFEDSSVLSIILICAACVATAMVMRGKLTRMKYLLLFFILLIPTTINETKATLILLPIGLVTTMLVASAPGRRLRVAVGAVTLLATFFAIFAPIYDYLERDNPYKVSIVNFFTEQEKFQHYVDQNADTGSKHVGRLDGITVPWRHLSRDPVQFAFGVGIGNASHSQMGEHFTGAYYLIFQKFLLSSLTSFMLEIGIFGTALVFVLYWMIFKDAVIVARSDETFMGPFAAAWTGIVAMTLFTLPYKTTYVFPSLSYFFWYLSGVVAARRMVLAQAAQPVRAPTPAPSIATMGHST